MRLKQKVLLANFVVAGLVAATGGIAASGLYGNRAGLLVVVIVCVVSACSGVLSWFWISKFIKTATVKVSEVSEGKIETDLKSLQDDELTELLEPVKKLADKYTQLSQEMLEQEQVDDRGIQTNNIPSDHNKKIECLYGLSKLMERSEIQLDDVFQKAVYLVKSAYRFPDKTCVRITYDGVQYKNEGFKKSEMSQYAQVNFAGEKAGSIEVYFTGERPASGDNIFLEEEAHLLTTVASQLGTIAEVKRSDEKMRLFRSLMDQSNDCIYVVEPDWGRFLYVNDRLCQAVGYSRSELLQMTLENIEAPVEGASVKECLKQAKEQGQVVVESRQRRNDSTVYIAETSLKHVRQNNRDYVIGISRDITERVQAGEAQAKLLNEIESANKELTDFAYVVSHDLKAPLRSIRTLAEWILGDCAEKLNENGRENLELLMRRAERMHNLIEGVLRYSRLGRAEDNRTRIDLNELVPEIMDMVAPDEGIKISVESKLPIIEADRTRISQVFQNLLSNAVKYMDKSQGIIKVDCVEDGKFWKFSVSDNGPGIEEKDFERIFKMFQTLQARDEYESTGVGLTLIKKIIELYGGRIWIESELGRGSTFFFTLPKKMGGGNERFEANIVCRG
jgi:PAS domain S-box-containing protein